LELHPIPLFDLYLSLVFLLGVVLRLRQYRTILGIVRAVPSRWPKLYVLVKQHSSIFLTWDTVWPLLTTLGLFVGQMIASSLLWEKTDLTSGQLIEAWPLLPLVAVCAAAMILFDIGGVLATGTVNRADVEKSLDQAEYWLRSWAAPVVRVFTLGYVNPRRLVTEEIRKALTEASKGLTSGLWWSSRQTALRLACGLSLWAASFLRTPLSHWLHGEG
ncbi:MAG: hypothetical protein JO247_22505, partial [Chloroflexi bacterium]|nr:hypothetical protein [Chloroflexota bacterium]